MDTELHPMHVEALASERLRFKTLWSKIRSAKRRGEYSKFESNTLIVEYFPDKDAVAVAISFNDGSDARHLAYHDAECAFRAHCFGSAS